MTRFILIEPIIYCPPQWSTIDAHTDTYHRNLKRTPLVTVRTARGEPAVGEYADTHLLANACRRLAQAYANESRRLTALPPSLLKFHHQPLLEQLSCRVDHDALLTLFGINAEGTTQCQVMQPEPGQTMSLVEALNWLALQYENRQRFPLHLYAIGFKRFWRPVLAQFLQGSIITHVQGFEGVESPASVVIWGRQSEAVREQAQGRHMSLIELEDGFIRSVGLGAEFARPLSWIADRQTLYFDASAPSDLESFLNQHKFTPEEKARAGALRQRMVKAGISKYNTGRDGWQRPEQAIAQGRDVILVAGQVERDASIKYGAPEGASNLKLLKRVRELEGNAYIIYKPHPDVVAGARAKGTDENLAFEIADDVVTDINITQMLTQIDRLHVMTSLAGFEAMQQGVDVVCHGMPFYAGWGLTTDMLPNPRRQANLCLDSLVFATLIHYPLYVSRDSGYYASAEHTLEQLNQWKAQGEGRSRLFKKLVRKALNLLQGRERRKL